MHIVTQNDVLSGGIFIDTVAYGGWPLDDHHPDGFYHAGNPNVWGRTPAPYGIPYRALYSVNIENLFFAGRNISATHAAMSSTRVIATCALLGEAVGTAANIAREFSLSPNGVYEEQLALLQMRLMENGCFLPYRKRRIPEVCQNASLTCEGVSPEVLALLRNGIDRNNRTYGEDDFRVNLPLGKAVTYTFDTPATLANIHLQFDTDLNRETLPGDVIDRKRCMRANSTQENVRTHLPTTLIKAFTLTAITESGEEVTLIATDCNTVGCVNCDAQNRSYRSVSFTPLSTWGDAADAAHIFSFDLR